MKKIQTIKIILAIVSIAVINSSCHLTKKRRIDSWVGKPLNHLISQSGFPDQVFYSKADLEESGIETPIITIVYHNNRIKKYNPDALFSKEVADSFAQVIQDSASVIRRYGKKEDNLKWRTFDFDCDSVGTIFGIGYFGMW